MEVLAYDPFVKETEIRIDIQGTQGVNVKLTTVTIEDVYKQSDFISLHVPGGELITSKEMELMKQGVILVNAARGGVINETDLIAALNSGKVAHVGLDVFKGEPQPNAEVLNHSKISLTPHIGAATNEAQERIGIELAEKVIDALK
jgi:D-3-phosphoglycerate dehydrogenase